MKDVALFLGAGASRGFGYPTTAEFLDALKREFSNDKRAILMRIARSVNVKDIEHVLKVIDAVIRFDSDELPNSVFSCEPQVRIPVRVARVKDAEGKTKLRFDELDWSIFVKQCKGTKEEIITSLHSHYAYDPTKNRDIVNAYDALVRLVRDIGHSEEIEIFTTNYDRIIEEYSSQTKLPVLLVDGFRGEKRTNRRFWFSDELERKGNTGILKLFKLHGSLDWRETYDGRIEQVNTEEKCSVAKKYKRNVLIYPTQEVYDEEPFGILQKHFKEAATQYRAFLVIGFSFRDTLLNSTFINHVRKGGTLVVVSPHAKDVVTSNLFDGLNKEEQKKLLYDRIRLVNGRFPNQKAFDGILKECFGL